MRRFLALGAVLLSIALPAFSQNVSPADRDKALQYLESTKQGVINATAGLSEAQWNFKPGPDRWSIAEVTEHIAVAEGYLRGFDENQVMKAPPRPEGQDVAAIDALVLSKVPDRTNKKQAPEPLKPNHQFSSGPDALKAFVDGRGQTEEFLKTHDDLRAHAVDSPLNTKLDAYEWILFIAAHSDRHTKQILEVKADPNFPKQ
jgi:DinB superfamily